MKCIVALLLLGCIVAASARRHPLARLTGSRSPNTAAIGDTCPAGTCSDSETCCQTPQGWGCCPYANADCCSDMEHCCPNGYTCDLSKGQCVKKSLKSIH